MKLFTYICAMLCLVTTIIICTLLIAAPTSIRGADKIIAVDAGQTNVLYNLVIDNLHFSGNNANVVVHVVPILPTQEARIEAVYSEGLDEYNFSAQIHDNEIRLSMEAEKGRAIKTFDVTVYAPINVISASGNGYRLVVDTPIVNNFSLFLSGNIQTTTSFNSDTDFLIASAGSSVVDVAGEARVARIAISGNSSVLGEYLVCDSAHVAISGTGNASLSIKNEMDVTLHGDSSLEYMGSPKIINQYVDEGSILKQTSQLVSSSLSF